MLRLSIALAGLTVTMTHPLCGLNSDEFYSPTAQSASFCTEYISSSCCNSFADNEVRQIFLADDVSAQCAPYHQQFLCTLCDPYQAHLFGLESADTPRNEPVLCADFCADYALNCPELAVNCAELVEEGPYCYPVSLPASSVGGLDLVFETTAGALIDYIDPSPSYPDELYATFDGKVLAVNKNNGQERELFYYPWSLQPRRTGIFDFRTSSRL